MIALSLSLSASAQSVEMADSLRSSGKIYVVIAVIGAIFLGIILFLINIDRKVTKIEKNTKQK